MEEEELAFTGILWSNLVQLDIRNISFFSIKTIRPHPKFQNINHYFLNDVAVITLEDKVQFSENLSPICLPPPEVENGPLDMFAGRYSTVTGYGRTETGKRKFVFITTLLLNFLIYRTPE